MNHSMYGADRQIHRRIIGSAFVVICIVIMLGTAAITGHEQQQASSVALLRAGMPVAIANDGYFMVR
jgi:energy-converting hydrogenase Eha subunit C